MLALIEIVADLLALASVMVIHEYQLSRHRIFEILFAHQSVGAKHYFIFVWNENSLVKIVTHYQLDVVFFQDNVVLEQSIAHGFPELVVFGVFIQMLLGLYLRETLESLDH